MSAADEAWERRSAALLKAIDDYDEATFMARIEALAAELPAGSAAGLFERGCAQDSTGHPDRAIPLYRAAIDAGLEREAVAESLTALAHYLPCYNRSLARYAKELTGSK